MLQWRCLVCVYLGRIDETISLALDEQAVSFYSFVFDFGPSLSSVRPSFYHYVRSQYTAMAIAYVVMLGELMARSRWTWTNRKYVCILVCLIFRMLIGFDLV